MGKLTITILDSIHCKANKWAREKIIPALAYENTTWKRGKYGRKSAHTITSHMITGRAGTAGTFLTGLLPRIKKYCKKNKIEISIIGSRNIENIPPTAKPKLKNIKFRPDQKKALRAIKRHNTGKITFPTGSGKTIIAMGIISMFPNCRTLFLCHTKDLIEQTLTELNTYFKKREIFIIGGGYKTKWSKIKRAESPIVLSTIQSFSKIHFKKYIHFFDITIVDEAHHMNSRKSQYGQVMEQNLSPRKYGLTATEPTSQKEILINEGIFGKVIGKLTIKEGIAKGIIAKPKINLVSVPLQPSINQISDNKYRNFYKYGISENKERNNLILKEVQKSIKKKEITLIIIDRTEHGFLLQNILKNKKINAPFIYGATKKEKRNKVRDDLKKGKLKIAICSKVWREGINIPALNHIINAAGMKEEKVVLQAIGRGLRTTDKKKTIKLTDFLDPYRYLAEHSIQRIQIYKNQGWI